MTLGFNTTGNSQTTNRTTNAISLGKLRNTLASTTRKFKYCNSNSPDLNLTFKCVFNGVTKPTFGEEYANIYHILGEDLGYIDNTQEYITQEYITEEDITEQDSQSKENLSKQVKQYKNLVFSGPFSPSQIKKAYSINNILPLPGVRKTIITIIAAFNNPYLTRDVSRFGKYFGLPPCNLKIFNFSRVFNSNWAAEVTLDVQWAYAINPYAEFRVIFAASNNWNHMFNAVNFANNKNNFSPKIDTDVISMSFGSNDNGGLGNYNNYFTNSNTIYVASCGNTSVVSFPSSSTNVLSIGGTSLRLNSNNSRNNETVWSASGCGYSKSFSKPYYQPSIRNINLRTTSDVSCIADPKTGVFIIINERLYSIGGTSLAAPIYAGMLSLLQQKRLNDRKRTYTSVLNKTNSIQPLLYNSSNKTCFFDVTSGSSAGYSAGVGFDIPSGLGVFNFANVINALS
jgi:subtilase family serine protease